MNQNKRHKQYKPKLTKQQRKQVMQLLENPEIRHAITGGRNDVDAEECFLPLLLMLGGLWGASRVRKGAGRGLFGFGGSGGSGFGTGMGGNSLFGRFGAPGGMFGGFGGPGGGAWSGRPGFGGQGSSGFGAGAGPGSNTGIGQGWGGQGSSGFGGFSGFPFMF